MKRKITAIILMVALVLALALPMAAVGASPGPGIVGLWHFDGDATDSSGNGNDGTLMGGATYGTGMFGQAVSLDGSDDYVSVPDSTSLDITSDITVEGWIKLASFSQPSTVAAKWRDISDVDERGYLLTVATDGTPRFYISTTGINFPRATGSALSLDTWYHLAGTYDGANIKLYVNGTLVDTQAQTGAIFSNNEPLLIGANDGYGGSARKFTNGLIDEVRVWDEALSSGQIGDVSPPVVTITAPAEGGCYKSADVPAAAYTVTDANSYSVVEDGYSTVEGPHTYTVTATDVLGYVGSDSITYTVDNTPPVVTITAPADGGYYPAGAVPAGDYTVVEVNPYTVVESGWSNDAGVHTYTVAATDCAGNVGDDSVTYTVLENFVTGGGKLNMSTLNLSGKKVAATFAGTVGVLEGEGIVGQIQIVDHTTGKKAEAWHCNNDFSFLNFGGPPTVSPPSSHSIVAFTGKFTSNRGSPDWTVTIIIQDVGEPGVGVDKIKFGGLPPYAIDGGNFQVHDLPAD